MIRILFADLHQGQRSWSRDEKAGHMTAPDHLAETSTNSLAKQEPSTHELLLRHSTTLGLVKVRERAPL